MARWIELVSLDDLLARPAPRNPKEHDLAGIRASVSRHGFVEAPTVDERTGRLVAGHGRLGDLAARRDAGEDPPEGVEVDEDGTWRVPTQRGWASRSEADAEAYVIAANKLTEAGGWDNKLLAEMLGDYRQDSDWLLGTGYQEKEVVSFLASLGGETQPQYGDAESMDLARVWGVIVEVKTEREQRDLLDELSARGLDVRAMIQ